MTPEHFLAMYIFAATMGAVFGGGAVWTKSRVDVAHYIKRWHYASDKVSDLQGKLFATEDVAFRLTQELAKARPVRGARGRFAKR